MAEQHRVAKLTAEMYRRRCSACGAESRVKHRLVISLDLEALTLALQRVQGVTYLPVEELADITENAPPVCMHYRVVDRLVYDEENQVLLIKVECAQCFPATPEGGQIPRGYFIEPEWGHGG